MADFRKITAVVRDSDPDNTTVDIILLDYEDPINTIKILTDDFMGLGESIRFHAEEIKDLSDFDPCTYLESIKWWQSGYDMCTDCTANEENITEEEFNNPPSKWKNPRAEINIVYDDIANVQERNDAIQEMLVDMVETSGEHGLTATDILISFMNNEMLQEERDEIIDRIKKED
jgi:hypothetical protein